MYHPKQILAQTLNNALDEVEGLDREHLSDSEEERLKFLSEVIISCDKALVHLESLDKVEDA